MLIGKKLTLSHLAMTLVPLGILAGGLLYVFNQQFETLDHMATENGVVVMLDEANEALTESALQRIQVTHDLKKKELEKTINQAIQDVEYLAKDPSVANLFNSVKSYHDNGGVREDGTLNTVSDTYQEIHHASEAFFDNIAASGDYYDVFLVCAKHGHVLFSQAGESDQGSNLSQGQGKDEGLARLWKKVISQERVVFEDFSPYSPSNGDQASFIGSPFYDESGSVKAVVAVQLSPETSNAIVQSQAGLGETGSSYLVGRSHDGQTYLRSDRVVKEGKLGQPKSGKFIDLALSGKSGIEEKTGSTGDAEFVCYSPIHIADLNWSLQTTISKEEVLAATHSMEKKAEEVHQDITLTKASALKSVKALSGILMAVFAGLAFAIAIFISRKITRPIREAATVADSVAEGDLSGRLDNNAQDEVGSLSRALDRMSDGLKQKADLAEAIASGNLTTEVTPSSDKDVFGLAFKKMTDNLNRILSDVNRAAASVGAGSREISDSSTSLSQGATEQAASLQEISSSMTEISSQVKINADNAGQADQLSDVARDSANTGVSQMNEMTEAMSEISSSSEEIAKIIKVIDDIAFQTNLLALNAAVEAARAGKHGKGFAVVAEEVRNLAGRSAKAARETAQLIEGSLAKVTNGTQIAASTSESLESIVEGITKASDLVGEIAAASNEQSQGIAEVSQGLSQIDNVTQQNTANSEETASAAQELADQARQLQQSMGHFQLRGGGQRAQEQQLAVSAVHNPVPAEQEWDNENYESQEEANPDEVIELTPGGWAE